MQIVPITREMTIRAQIKAQEMGPLKNSIRDGEGNLAGFLGEEAVLVACPGAISDNTYQHDLTWNQNTYEIKTKDRTVVPDLSYEASVADYNTRQNADFYLFVSLLRASARWDDLQRASDIVSDDFDVLKMSLECLSYVLSNLDDSENALAATMFRLYRLTASRSVDQNLPLIISSVRKNHKLLATQREVLASFGIDPRLIETSTAAYIMGKIKKTDYKPVSTFLREGDIDPSNGWIVSADCYNLPYSHLLAMDQRPVTII